MLNLKRSTTVTQQDYRRTNDGVMVADIGFKKQLWALDPELEPRVPYFLTLLSLIPVRGDLERIEQIEVQHAWCYSLNGETLSCVPK